MIRMTSSLSLLVGIVLGCGHEAPADSVCIGTSQSTLPGVSFVFDRQPCERSLGEAVAGFDISYVVDIEAVVPTVAPRSQDSGGCEQPGASGLTVHAQFGDSPHVYCECDTGLCPSDPQPPVDLQPGTFADHVHIQARDWNGPSDTGIEPGEAFPAGNYDVILSATGTVVVEASTWPFTVSGRYQLRLTQ